MQDVNGVREGENNLVDIKGAEALILHELCHWGRHKTGTEDDYYQVDGIQLDSGDMFKRDAYIDPNRPHLG